MQGIAKPVSVYATALGAQQAADPVAVTEPLSLRSTGTAEKILGRPCEVKGVVQWSNTFIKNNQEQAWEAIVSKHQKDYVHVVILHGNDEQVVL